MSRFFQKVLFARTPSQRYRQILQRVDDLTPPTTQEIKTYFAQLRLIASMLPREVCRFQIEGGMSLALHCGAFSRRHGDVDISILEDSLHTVERLLADNGYGLFSRNAFHAFEYAPWDVLQPLTANQILHRKRVKRLTAVKLANSGSVDPDESLLPRFDLHIHREDDDVVWLERGSVAFPRDLFFDSKVFYLKEQAQVNLASLALTYYYKSTGKRLRHRRDLQIIEQQQRLYPDKSRHSSSNPQWANHTPQSVFLDTLDALTRHLTDGMRDGDEHDLDALTKRSRTGVLKLLMELVRSFTLVLETRRRQTHVQRQEPRLDGDRDVILVGLSRLNRSLLNRLATTWTITCKAYDAE